MKLHPFYSHLVRRLKIQMLGVLVIKTIDIVKMIPYFIYYMGTALPHF